LDFEAIQNMAANTRVTTHVFPFCVLIFLEYTLSEKNGLKIILLVCMCCGVQDTIKGKT
jgi:hypothetical protein